MGHAGGQEDPVAHAHAHPFTPDLQHGGAGEEGDPLVLVLEVVLRGDIGAAQDLFDDDVAKGDDRFDALAGGRDISLRPQRAPEWGERDGLVGVVLAHDGAPAPTAVVARADPAQEQDDEEHEKEDREHG